MFPLLKEGPLIRLSTDVLNICTYSNIGHDANAWFLSDSNLGGHEDRVGKGVGIDRRLCFLVWKVALEMIVSLLVTGDVHCRPETHIWNTNYVYDGN